jgi:hypothetical protein
MTGYTLTIVPDDSDNAVKTTVRVDTSSGIARVIELVVSAGEGGTLSPRELPAVNFEALISALSPPPSASTAAVSGGPQQVVTGELPARGAQNGSAPGAVGTGGDAVLPGIPTQPSGEPSEEDAGSAATTAKTRKAAAARAKGGGAGRSGRSGRSGRGRSAKPSAGAASNGRTAAGEARAYRRMPDQSELIDAYRQASSVTGLAEQYGVPRHTMNGWLGRLRQQGLLESTR